MWLFAVEVHDWFAAVFGTGGASAIVYAVWRGVVALTRQRGENAAAESEAENRREELLQKGDARTFKEMQVLVGFQQQWIQDRDEKIEELTVEVAECKADRAAMSERLGWLEKAFHKGEGDTPPPRTKSDHIRVPKPEGDRP